MAAPSPGGFGAPEAAVWPPRDSSTFPLSVSTLHPCPAGTLREKKESLCNLFII